MLTVDDLREAAFRFPEVSEATHFGLPAFKVRDKVFLVLQQGETHAIVHVGEDDATQAETIAPGASEPVRRNAGKIFVGIRVDLSSLHTSQLEALTELGWRHRAPKRVVAAHDAAIEDV